MPGKINPVIPEYAASAGIQVIACDSAVTQAAAMGQLELNAFMPVIAENLLEMIVLLTGACRTLKTACIDGITANREICLAALENSAVFATLLAPYIGYDSAAGIVKYAGEKGLTIRKAAVEMKYFTNEELDIIFDPRQATSPGISGSKQLKDRLNLKIDEDKK